ncbi:hypothetical protein C823_006223 [Eubacterium plexicaudatum ASF492]|uniref:Uncharacterized protein n=1 Tax=Eubacterium plexicaudatum ASF492 TaxID=1235802 RepID=N2AGL1_9FIRM|nr:hypothetical protein C823_006223 [Eubacterium plexicaudatum ASF492]
MDGKLQEELNKLIEIGNEKNDSDVNSHSITL